MLARLAYVYDSSLYDSASKVLREWARCGN